VLLASSTSTRASQATLVADAHINSALPSTNSGAISNLDVGGGYTTLLQFDLSLLPTATTPAQVSRAVLKLYINRVTTPGLVSLAPLTSSWGEYSVTFATQPSTSASIGSVSVTQAGSFIAIDVTSLVQSWIATPASNNGLALSAATAFVQFDSKENDLTAHPATLEVDLVNQGPTGSQGPTGATGPQGFAGIAGASGPIGLPGAAGARGLQGLIGLTGAIGPAGVPGSQGSTGLTGAIGPVGPQGLTGASGAAGPQGPAGTGSAAGLVYQGAYASTTNYALGNVVVWQGSSYSSLIASNNGNTPSLSPLQWGILTAQGPAGPIGVTGPTGSPGPQGLPGSVGPNGSIGPQGLQGIAGQAGAQGIPGTTGATGLSGPMGPQGVPGPVGMTYQGGYSPVTNYALADAVSYNGSSYVSLVASNHGNTPGQSPFQWAIFAAGATGTQGPAGTPGLTGPTGNQGPQGFPGPTGNSGATGPPGPPVANYLGNYQSSTNYAFSDAVSWQGSTYISLSAGNQGNTPSLSPSLWAVLAAQGLQGLTGSTGAPGSSGATGPAGTTGSTGPQGPPVTFQGEWLIGSSYALGDAVAYANSSYIAVQSNSGRQPDLSPVSWTLLAAAGSAGPPGSTGSTGFQGPTGLAGLPGSTGPQGPSGPAGVSGPQGPTGQTGSQGLTGATGQTGATGANGISGTIGPPGSNGVNGLPGIAFRGPWTASSGYLTNDSVTYGTPASTYIAISGNNSQDPIDYPTVWTVLAQAGSVGPTGPTGLAASLTIGSVTTAAAGSQALVSNTGTPSAAILNFTIPQGATGPPGSGSATGGGTSGIPFASVYHAVSYDYLYYSVNNPDSSAAEIGTAPAPASTLTWLPSGCTATALSAFSQQTNPITVTLRVGASSPLTNTTLACTAQPGASCTGTGSVTVPAGSFVDLTITGPSGTPAAVWTALTCN
jgi:hypothetical protein